MKKRTPIFAHIDLMTGIRYRCFSKKSEHLYYEVAKHKSAGSKTDVENAVARLIMKGNKDV